MCKKVSPRIYRIQGRKGGDGGGWRRGGISKRKGIKKKGIIEVTKFLQRLSFVPISLFPLLFFASAKFPTVGTSSLSSCTESFRKSHLAFLLFQSFANLFLSLSPFSSLSLRFSYRSPEPLTYTFVSLVTFTWTLSSSAVCIAPVAVAVAVAAGGGCAFPNFETLTKSRAR